LFLLSALPGSVVLETQLVLETANLVELNIEPFDPASILTPSRKIVDQGIFRLQMIQLEDELFHIAPAIRKLFKLSLQSCENVHRG